MTGLEMALKAAGLSEVLDAAKRIAESGAVQKIIAFADEMEGLRNDVRDIKAFIEGVASATDDGRNILPPASDAALEPERRLVAGEKRGRDGK